MDMNELVKKAKLGDEEAKERILKDNMAFINKVINDTFTVIKFPNIDRSDLMQEGLISMLIAIDNFDAGRNVKFLTYAYYVIKRNLLNVLEDSSRFIRIPGSNFWLLKRYVSIYKELEVKLRKKPSVEQMAKEMHISKDKILVLEKLVDNVVSIDDVVEYDLAYNQFYDDCDLFRSMMNNSLAVKFVDIFNRLDLSDREIEIVKLRFGFYDRVYSLREIAEKYDIKHQRVDQIINRIIEKIKLSECAEELVDYTDDSYYYMEKISEYRNNNKRKRKILLK